MANPVVSSEPTAELDQSTPAASWLLSQPDVWIWERSIHRALRNRIPAHSVERKSLGPHCSVFVDV